MKMIQNRKFVIVAAALAVVAVIVSVLYVHSAAAAKNTLTLSGTVETTKVSISPEASGKITAMNVQEGDVVKAGEVLFTLDDTILQAQQQVAVVSLASARAGADVAQNALNTAKAKYQIALENALAQDKQTRLHDWFAKDPQQFDQPAWYFNRGEQIKSAQTQVDLAKDAMDQAQTHLTTVTGSVDDADFLKAEERLLNARIAYLISRTVNDQAQNSTSSDQPVGAYNSTHCGTNQGYQLENAQLTNLVYDCKGDPQLSDAGRKLYDAAQSELNAAQELYNALLNTKAADEVLQARAEVQVTQEQYYAALDFLRSLQTGDQSPDVTAAQSAMDQAQATADQAQKAVEQAQANLNLWNAQIANLTVEAPSDGVVLTREAEPGENVTPNSVVLTTGRLDALTITVFVPENRLGNVSIGQSADMTVDSYPGEKFKATVINISDQAEFTPRNVQTAEGRQTTVFAVKLKLQNTSGKLKPGMPGDVTFVSK